MGHLTSHQVASTVLETRADQTTNNLGGDDPKEDKKISFKELYAEVCKFANGLKELGVKRVTA